MNATYNHLPIECIEIVASNTETPVAVLTDSKLAICFGNPHVMAKCLMNKHSPTVALNKCIAHGKHVHAYVILDEMAKPSFKHDNDEWTQVKDSVGNSFKLAISLNNDAMCQHIKNWLENQSCLIDRYTEYQEAATLHGHLALLRSLGAVPVPNQARLASMAADRGYDDIIQFFTEEFTGTAWYDDALRHAYNNRHNRCLRTLLLKKMTLAPGATLIDAAQYGDHDVAYQLLNPDRNFDANIYGDAFVKAAGNGDCVLMDGLLTSAHPPALDYADGKALMWASKNGHYKAAEMLCQLGLRADIRQGEALCLAAKYGHMDIVKMLLASPHPPRVDCQNDKALWNACGPRNLEMVTFLLNYSQRNS